jgi:hypothetical protein
VEPVPPDETGPVPVHVVDTTPVARLRESAVGRATATGVQRGRELAVAAFEMLKARSRAQRRLMSLRAEIRRLAPERERLLRDLGEAVYRGDEEATEAVRARISGLDESIERMESEMQTIAAEAGEQVADAQASVSKTEMIEPPRQPDIPEPYPPPGELDPPTPPEIPEPYPPPGETDPPVPPQIPEPYPPAEPQ